MVRRGGIRAQAGAMLLVLVPLLLLSACGLPSSSVLGPALDLAMAPPDLIIVGAFTTVNGVERTNIARIDSNGQLRESFFAAVNGKISTVKVMWVGDDPVLLVGGLFTQINGEERVGVAVLNTDGSLRPEFSRLIDNSGVPSVEVEAILPIPERGTVLLGGIFDEVYETPVDTTPTADKRYAGLVEVEWPAGTVRTVFQAGETLDYGLSSVKSLASGFSEAGWTVAVAGELIVNPPMEDTFAAILDSAGNLADYVPGSEYYGVAHSVKRDSERGLYIFAGELFEMGSANPLSLLEYTPVPLTLTRVIALPGAGAGFVRTAELLGSGRVLLAGSTSLVDPETAAIVLGQDGIIEDVVGEINPGETIRIARRKSSGLYLGGDFTDFLLWDRFLGEVRGSVFAGGLVRFQDGNSLDTGFSPRVGALEEIYDIAELPPRTK
jgi:hypothetical protein